MLIKSFLNWQEKNLQLFRCETTLDSLAALCDGIDVLRWDRHNPLWKAVMPDITAIDLDLTGNVTCPSIVTTRLAPPA